MPIMSQKWRQGKAVRDGMISPFINSQVREIGEKKIISYGVSSYGYDARVSNEFKIFTNINTTIVDPKILIAKAWLAKKLMFVSFRQTASP